MKLEILGGGCARCKKLAESAEQALRENNIDGSVEKVEDLNAIMEYQVTATPALVMDGKVLSSGKLLSPADVYRLIRKTE